MKRVKKWILFMVFVGLMIGMGTMSALADPADPTPRTVTAAGGVDFSYALNQ